MGEGALGKLASLRFQTQALPSGNLAGAGPWDGAWTWEGSGAGWNRPGNAIYLSDFSLLYSYPEVFLISFLPSGEKMFFPPQTIVYR